MAKPENAIFTNMCMVYDGKGNILVQNRLNLDWPGITFPGGHVEPGESFVESVIREVGEETGSTIRKPRLCGLKQFLRDDGEVFWIKRSELGDYRLANDFENMLRVFESEDLSEFYYEKVHGEWQLTLL